MTAQIGQWIRRRGQKWHLAESVVAGDVVTRCGRRMDRVTRTGGELQVSALMPLTRMIGQPQLCKAGCDDGLGDGRPEDDGSTAPEDETP
jgi:hypothetical protein